MAANRRWQGKAMRQTIDGNRISTTGWLALWVLSVGLVLGLGTRRGSLGARARPEDLQFGYGGDRRFRRSRTESR